MGNRKILGVTGIRSEYDIMSSVFKAIHMHDCLDLKLAVMGAHLSDMYGYTISEIYNDGFLIVDEIDSLLNSDRDSARVKGLGIQLQSLVQTVTREKPDILLVLGDREESITTALIGAYMNIPVAHIGGGDRVVGNVDDQIRHAVSKLAHIHFVTNIESENRLVKLGEQPFRIYNVGNPGLDRLLAVEFMSKKEISESLGFNLIESEPILMVIQHVLSSEIDHAYSQMTETLIAIEELGIQTILSCPNSDAGGQQMIKAIDEFRDLPNLYVAKNIPRKEFVNLFRIADCLLGNSSAGILEAPLLHLPVVNVGNRQIGRLHSNNVLFVSHNRKEIKDAVLKSLFDEEYKLQVAKCKNPYGNGDASNKIVEILNSITLDNNLIIKDITY